MVNILDVSSFKDELKNIFEKLMEMQTMVDNLLFSLNEEVQGERKLSIKSKSLLMMLRQKL